MMSESKTSLPSLRNENWKTINVETEQHHRIKQTNLCRSKISQRKHRGFPKKNERKFKTWMEN